MRSDQHCSNTKKQSKLTYILSKKDKTISCIFSNSTFECNQTSRMERFVKIVQNAPSEMFHWVLNTPLY